VYIGWPASRAPFGSGITTYDGSERLSDPSPYNTHEAGNDAAGEEFVLRRRVDHHVAMTRPQHRDVVDAAGRVREQVRDLDPGLTVLPKRAPRAEQPSVVLNELVLRFAELRRSLLSVELVQQRLGIKRLDVTRAARHEQENHRPGPGRMMRLPARQRIGDSRAGLFLVQQRGQRQPAEPATRIPHEVASRASRLRVTVGWAPWPVLGRDSMTNWSGKGAQPTT
jgi:hypothetical protein